MVRRRSIPLPLLVVLAAACSTGIDPLVPRAAEPGGATGELAGVHWIQTDSARYRVRSTPANYSVSIGITLTNRSTDRLHIPACQTPYPPVLEKLEGSEWVMAYNPPVLLCLGLPVVVEPGAVYSLPYEVMASRVHNGFPRFEVTRIAGTYRLRWMVLRVGPGGQEEPLPGELRLSPSFELVL